MKLLRMEKSRFSIQCKVQKLGGRTKEQLQEKPTDVFEENNEATTNGEESLPDLPNPERVEPMNEEQQSLEKPSDFSVENSESTVNGEQLLQNLLNSQSVGPVDMNEEEQSQEKLADASVENSDATTNGEGSLQIYTKFQRAQNL